MKFFALNSYKLCLKTYKARSYGFSLNDFYITILVQCADKGLNLSYIHTNTYTYFFQFWPQTTYNDIKYMYILSLSIIYQLLFLELKFLYCLSFSILECEHLIRHMLVVDPDKRMSLEHASHL